MCVDFLYSWLVTPFTTVISIISLNQSRVDYGPQIIQPYVPNIGILKISLGIEAVISDGDIYAQKSAALRLFRV